MAKLPMKDPPKRSPKRKPKQRGTTRAERAKLPPCGAATRSGKPCQRPAGHGTNHPGEGKCKLHGGATPVKHGRYARIQRERIRQLIDEFASDPDPLNLLPELELLRALIIDFVERYDENAEALLRWNRTFDRNYRAAREMSEEHGEDPDGVDPLGIEPSKPDKVVDILSVGAYITQISSIVDRIRKSRETQTFSMATIDKLWEAQSAHLMQATQEVISDPALRESVLTAVAQRWGTINLAAIASGRAPEGEGQD